ncbi:MAG TPA: serine hydrolase [Streptosporangiaceae bacterium]|nr:serine hydrolase [Streptosporangiaceae bacterium]
MRHAGSDAARGGGARLSRQGECGRPARGGASRSYIGTEHLLLGLLDAEPTAGALTGLGSSARALRGQVHRTLCDAAPGGEWRVDGPGSAPGEVAPTSHPALAAIAAEEPVAGLSWADSRDDREVLTAAYGWADQFRGVPVTADTRFRAGSVTKIATALLVLQLRDHGLADLDEPAMAKLRSVRLIDHDGAPSAATVRQVLTHTAGLPRASGLRHYAGPVPAPGELFTEGIRAERPGGPWSYSNLGFVALGALAADLLGAPFGVCLEEWVLEPLGLAESVSLPQLPASGLPAGATPPRGTPGGETPPGGRRLARRRLAGRRAAFRWRVVTPSTRAYSFRSSRARSSRWARATWSRVPVMWPALAAAVVNGPLLPPESTREMLAPYVRCGPETWQNISYINSMM